jgi:hypothetical protein
MSSVVSAHHRTSQGPFVALSESRLSPVSSCQGKSERWCPASPFLEHGGREHGGWEHGVQQIDNLPLSAQLGAMRVHDENGAIAKTKAEIAMVPAKNKDGSKNGNLSIEAMGALSIEIIRPFRHANFPGLVLVPARLVVCFSFLPH